MCFAHKSNVLHDYSLKLKNLAENDPAKNAKKKKQRVGCHSNLAAEKVFLATPYWITHCWGQSKMQSVWRRGMGVGDPMS